MVKINERNFSLNKGVKGVTRYSGRHHKRARASTAHECARASTAHGVSGDSAGGPDGCCCRGCRCRYWGWLAKPGSTIWATWAVAQGPLS